ncbi:hypothetical protein [Arcanobacterium hippocoleae]|uniref:Chromosome segregation ATPase n=1 Tax=Arcanobacterium hippocoleae TaxID=149017 RepID=A0ABU1T0C0_9ACTO|nr:hypothetical protein [Arcanobacterium hippocoleae]MDR6938802.1 chromosome segregation ATPase [Arcanobacterium hippocoleae]
MKLKKTIAGAILAGALCFSGTTAAFAAEYTPGSGKASVENAVAARDKVVTDTNKIDRPAEKKKADKKLEETLTALKAQIEAKRTELEKSAADLEKALKASDKAKEDLKADAAAKIPAIDAEIKALNDAIKKIEFNYEIRKAGVGETAAKAQMKDELAKIDLHKKEIKKKEAEKAHYAGIEKSPAFAVANQAIKDNTAKLAEVKKQLEIVSNDAYLVGNALRNVKYGINVTPKHDITATPKADKKPAAPAPKVEKKAEAAKKAADVKKAEAKKAADVKKAEAKKLANTGAGIAAVAGIAGLIGLAGVGIRRKFN